MKREYSYSCYNNELVHIEDLPIIAFDIFYEIIVNFSDATERLVALFVQPKNDEYLLFAIISDRENGLLNIYTTPVKDSFPSLTNNCVSAHWFEREIFDLWGIKPIGHPWLKPIRFTNAPIGKIDFFQFSGTDVHEVAVGPVHAGVIEPGHFRFSCDGETVLFLEISLGFQHRGVEQAIKFGPDKRTIHYMETLAGDSSVGHATAYSQNIETLSHSQVTLRGMTLRSIALELERLANHCGDLGALAGDVGYLPVAAQCGRIRGDFLNITAIICGNRLGRGIAIPGGVGFNLDDNQIDNLLDKLDGAFTDLSIVAKMLWDSPSTNNRFEEIGILTKDYCLKLGIVGPPARAVGIQRDVRLDYPSDIYSYAQIPISLWHTGDVFARAYVRWLEIKHSYEFIKAQIKTFSEEPISTQIKPLEQNSLSISLVEGWRGEICHIACTNHEGKIEWYKIIDPSFHNWAGLSVAMRNQQISDFPVCNKSFNLSYCGHDL